MYRGDTEGVAIRPAFSVDGVVIGRAAPNSFCYADRPPGAYEVYASSDKSRGLTVNVEGSEEIYVRFDVDVTLVSWRFTPVQVSSITGRAEIADTRFVGHSPSSTH